MVWLNGYFQIKANAGRFLSIEDLPAFEELGSVCYKTILGFSSTEALRWALHADESLRYSH
jgi:hypothetical protein